MRIEKTMDAYRVIIRQARASDSASLQALYFELTMDNNVRVMSEGIEAAFGDPRTRLLVAETNGEVCGTALVSLCADVMYGDQPFAVIENVVVTKGSRGNGVGARIMESVESFCLESDCTKVMLLSSVSRIDAHKFFEHAGFVGDKKLGFVKYRRDFRPAIHDAHNASVNKGVPYTARLLPK